MPRRKSIDDLVRSGVQKQAELQRIKSQIQKSVRNVAVLFIDLCNSTELKATKSPDEWLGYVYEFIKKVDNHTTKAGGIVVKRIGDELMVSFNQVRKAERFLDSMDADPELQDAYEFKVAADFGEAYHFKFVAGLKDDPYGIVVDRCSRMARLAFAKTTLASSSYVEKLPNIQSYFSLGKFPLKGLPEHEEIFMRKPKLPFDPHDYYRRIVDALNSKEAERTGYRYIARHFDSSYFQVAPKSFARPFLLLYLLNVPALPLTLDEFLKKLESLQREVDRDEFIGFLVNWEAVFSSYSKIGDSVIAHLRPSDEIGWKSITLRLVPSMYDIVRTFNKNDRVSFRSIIETIDGFGITLNYVELTAVNSGSGKK